MKATKVADKVSLGLIAGGSSVTAALYDKLPARMPIHFDFRGVADGWMEKEVGAWLLPVIALATVAILRVGPRFLGEAARLRMEKSPMELATTFVVGMLVALQVLILHAAIARPASIATELAFLLGVSWVLLGLILPRLRRNPWMGVRLPWTLASDDNWARTHRVAGWAFALSGVAGVLLAIAGAPSLAVVVIALAGVVPIVYSYRLSRTA
jgi:uncharacterized membrane protein